MSELSMEEKVRLNAACHGDQTVALTRNEMDYCWRRLKGDGMFADEIARKLRVDRAELAKWEAAGRSLRGRDKFGNPVDVFEPAKVSRAVPDSRSEDEMPQGGALPPTAPTSDGLPAQAAEIKPGRLQVLPPKAEVVAASPLVAAAQEVERTAQACRDADAAHHAAVERLQDEISAIRFPEAAEVFARELAPEEPAAIGYDPGETVDLAAVRAWAKEQGIPVAPRGRVAAEVIERYREAHAS